MGQWNVQNGLKLSYSGDSIWHADCVVRKSDFPLKYPCGSFSLEFFLLCPCYEILICVLAIIRPSLSLSSLTDVPHISTVNMEKQETSHRKMVQTVTLLLIPQILNQDTFSSRMG